MMTTASQHHPLSGLVAFWAEAGVDCAYGEAAVDRLAERLSAPSAPAVPLPSRPPTAALPSGDDDAALLQLARNQAGACADLAALETAIAAFPWGARKARGARTVFSRGPAPAEVVLVGEWPGAEEDGRGEPFAGRSGQLLDRMLAAAGLAERTFITNTVFFRPPAERAPTVGDQALCRPFLERAIALAAPRALVLAGGASAKFLLGRSEGVMSLRGRWFDWSAEAGGASLPALPMLHPAFLLRQPAAKAQAWRDLLTLLSRLEGPG